MINNYPDYRNVQPKPVDMDIDPLGCEVTLTLRDLLTSDGARCGIGMSVSVTGGDPKTSGASRIIQIFVDTVLTDAATIRDIVLEQRAKRYPEATTTNPEGSDHE